MQNSRQETEMWSESQGLLGLKSSATCGHAGPSNPAETLVINNSQTCKAELSADKIPDRLHFQGYHDSCPLFPAAVVSCPLVLG